METNKNLEKRFSPAKIEEIVNQFRQKYPLSLNPELPVHYPPVQERQKDSEEELVQLINNAVQNHMFNQLRAELEVRQQSDRDMTCFPQYSLALIIEATANKTLPETILEDLCQNGVHFNVYNEALLINYTAEGKIKPVSLALLLELPWRYEIYSENLILFLNLGLAEFITDYCEVFFPEIDF